MYLQFFEKNVKSQFGEDGVIEEIFKRIGVSNKFCIEFGAWDGMHLSNIWNLWHNNDWNALLIESDSEKYKELIITIQDFPKVKPLLAFIRPDGENSLDSILQELDFPNIFDLLSIDIDGNDFYIFKGLNKHTPRVLLIEYNPTIPPSLEVVQKEGEYFGSSALSILNLAHNKGYKLAHMTDTNMILIHESEFDKMGFEEPPLEHFFVNKHLTYLISSYDGQSYLFGPATYSNFKASVETTSHPDIISDNNNLQKVIVYKTKHS